MARDIFYAAPAADAGREDKLSLAWVMAGVVMFAIALGAPVAVFQLHNTDWVSVEEPQSASGKPVATTSREAEAPSASETLLDPLSNILDHSAIVPGVGIGPVLLDTEVRDILARMEEPSVLSFDMSESGLQGTHRVDADDFSLVITAEPGLGPINSVALSAHDCAALRNAQTRMGGLPSTESGLSLGSHASRVRTTLGTPDAQSAASGQPPKVLHTYPGISLSYCAQDMIVESITIDRMPPAPLIADTGPEGLPSSSEPDHADTVIVSLGQMTSDTVDSPGSPPTELPAGQAGAGSAGSALLPEWVHGRLTANAPMLYTPETLLALNGNAFTVGDAFSAPRQPRDHSAFASAAPPPELLLAVIRASTEQETNAEFQGVGDFMAYKAAEVERKLELSTRARVSIQRRLKFIGYDPKGVDGIFGPNTRQMIAAMQADRGLAQTGFLSADLLAMLQQESEPRYRAWERDVRIARAKAAKAAKTAAAKRRAKALALAEAEERAKRTTVLAARKPAARNAPECARDQNGTIISNQSFSCDVTVLEESLDALFSGRS